MPIFDIELPDKRVLSIEAADEAAAVGGAQEWHKAHPQAEMRAHDPSWRDRIASALMPEDPKASPVQAKVVEALTGSRGLGQTGVGALDVFPPTGAALAFDESKRAAESGHLGEAAIKALGAIPAPASKLLAQGVQAAARSTTPQALTAAQEVAEAATRQSIDLPRAANVDPATLTGNMVQRTAGALKEIPVVGSPLATQARKAGDQITERAAQVSESFAPTTSQQTAGATAKEGMTDWARVESSQVSKKLYDKVDTFMPNAAWRPLSSTKQVVDDIRASMLQSGSPVNQRALDFVEEALAKPQGLNYQGLKQLRTDVGHLLDGTIMPEAGTPIPALKRIYGGLTEDLKATIGQFGGADAMKAWNKADSVGKIIATRRDAIAKVVGKDAAASDEKVLERLVSFAGSKSSADITKLLVARKAMGADAWGEVSAQAIQRLGRNQANEFSPSIFAKNYGALSENGRSVLFNSTGKGSLKQALDDIALVSGKFKELEKLGNPSGTGRVASLLGAAGSIAYGAVDPLTGLSLLIGGGLLARAMAKPVTANSISRMLRSAYQATQNPHSANMAMLNHSLARLAGQLAEEDGSDPAEMRAKLGVK